MTTHLYILTGASRGLGLAMAQQLLQTGNSLVCMSRRANPELAEAARQAEVPLTIAAARSPPKCALRKDNHGGRDGRKGVTWVIDLIELSCIVDSANKPNLERRR